MLTQLFAGVNWAGGLVRPAGPVPPPPGPAVPPPERLFHGTAWSNFESIRTQGLLGRTRGWLFASPQFTVAESYGHGKSWFTWSSSPTTRYFVAAILAGEMSRAGLAWYPMYGIHYVTYQVPPEFIAWDECWRVER